MINYFETLYTIWTSIVLIFEPSSEQDTSSLATNSSQLSSPPSRDVGAPLSHQVGAGNQAILADPEADLASYRAGDGNCDRRYFNGDVNRIVCACGEKYCDNYDFEWPENFGQAFVYQSSQEGERFKRQLDSKRDPSVLAKRREIRVNLLHEHQKIMGWGGGFTDSAGLVIQSLKPQLVDALMEAYFGKGGSRYNFGRLPMGGTDFSDRLYTYDDSPEPDYELKNFALQPEEFKYKIPIIKKAMALARQLGNELKLFVSPWGAPTWVSRNNSHYKARLINNSTIYSCHAEAYVKFLNAYRDQGVNIWGGSVQNEPVKLFMDTHKPIAGVVYCDGEMRNYIGQYLGPILSQHGYNKTNFKLMIGDDLIGVADQQIAYAMSDPLVERYVSGLAYHFYFSGHYVPYKAISDLWEPLKSKLEFALMTEASETILSTAIRRTDPGDWERGQHYASDIIEDLLRGTSGWVDWNLALNMAGGPSYVNNTIDASILVDEARNEFYKLPTYYTQSHFSRFLKPGSVRVEAGPMDDLDDVGRDLMFLAARNKNSGHLIVNILNRADYKQEARILVDGLGAQQFEIETVTLAAKSINTVLIKIE